MGRAMTSEAERRAPAPLAGEGDSFDILRELTRSGYVPDTSDIETSGILLRHVSAPDLVLHADGRLEVPLGQPRKSGMARLVPGSARGMSWRRTIFVALLIGIVWFFSAFLTAAFFEM